MGFLSCLRVLGDFPDPLKDLGLERVPFKTLEVNGQIWFPLLAFLLGIFGLMSGRINEFQWIIHDIPIKIKRLRIEDCSSDSISARKPTLRRRVVPSEEVIKTRFNIPLF